MNDRYAPTIGTITAVLLATACAGLLWAGPLDPPAGPVAPTGKTLTEIEPRIAINAVNTPGDANSTFKITASGSYYFTGNLTGAANKYGIEIGAPNVTIDLNGFTFRGVANSINAFTASGLLNVNVTVENGTVRDWGGSGAHLVDQFGSSSIVRNIHASNNGGRGIYVGPNSLVTGCTAADNLGAGIDVDDGSTVTSCTSKDNDVGFTLADGCHISACAAARNTLKGIQTGAGCAVLQSVALLNGSNGINTGAGCVVRDCSSISNSGNGFFVSSGSRVESCSARLNDTNGITISTTGACVILGNSCVSNGQAGVFAGISTSGADNRIEGNNCSSQDVGIDVNNAGNIIIRNTCSGNTTNWTIAANNYYGPIINRQGIATAAVNGDAAASTLNTTEPNANFTY